MTVREAVKASLKMVLKERGPWGLFYDMAFVWNKTSWKFVWVAIWAPKTKLM